jgi:hypothetical protein
MRVQVRANELCQGDAIKPLTKCEGALLSGTDQETGCIIKAINNQALCSTLNPIFAALVILLIRGRIDWMEKVYISAVRLDVASFAMITS